MTASLTSAATPPEARGLTRDGVRMLVAGARGLDHLHAYDLPDVLQPGDVLVINTSKTLPAALSGETEGKASVEVHLSTVRPGDLHRQALAARSSRWVVEIRTPLGDSSSPLFEDLTGRLIRLDGGGKLRVESTYPDDQPRPRLWLAQLDTPDRLDRWLESHGRPIQYAYVSGRWPISAYRTAVADSLGSAEMPSAGRVLTPRLLARLTARGVRVAKLVLHCGVSSLESDEPPYPEWYSVPTSTAKIVNQAVAEGRRVVAVGTTVVRALESAVDPHGLVQPGDAWTDLVITAERGGLVIDGLLTGWHEPRSSHLQMLQAIAGPEAVSTAYRAALEGNYLWHEFGDVHLLFSAAPRGEFRLSR